MIIPSIPVAAQSYSMLIPSGWKLLIASLALPLVTPSIALVTTNLPAMDAGHGSFCKNAPPPPLRGQPRRLAIPFSDRD